MGSTPTPIVIITMLLVEYFCEKCSRVLSSAGNFRCCGIDAVEFDLAKHGRHLIAKANSWGNIERSLVNFYNHPLYKEAEQEFIKCGNSSLSGILLLFIDKLAKNQSEMAEWFNAKV